MPSQVRCECTAAWQAQTRTHLSHGPIPQIRKASTEVPSSMPSNLPPRYRIPAADLNSVTKKSASCFLMPTDPCRRKKLAAQAETLKSHTKGRLARDPGFDPKKSRPRMQSARTRVGEGLVSRRLADSMQNTTPQIITRLQAFQIVLHTARSRDVYL